MFSDAKVVETLGLYLEKKREKWLKINCGNCDK